MTTVQEPSAPEAASTPDIHTTAGKLADLRERQAKAQAPVGEAAIEKVHAKGKMTARERITALLDEGSFVEIDALARHRSTNFGLATTVPSATASSPATAPSTAATSACSPRTRQSSAAARRGLRREDRQGHGPGATHRPTAGRHQRRRRRPHPGSVVSLGLYGEIFHRNVQASGVIPQISLIMGPLPVVTSTPPP